MPPKSPVRPGLPTVAEAVTAMLQARARGPGRRSALYLWLRDNHDALTAAFAQNAPAWGSLASYLGEHGIMDGDAKPPTARGTRDAWWRVRKDVAAARARRQGKPAQAMEARETAPDVNPIPVPAMAPPPVSAETGDAAGEPPPRSFKAATLRGHKPAPPSPLPAPPTPTKSAPDEVQDPDEVISRFIGRPPDRNSSPAIQGGDHGAKYED
jgi:hypothetical protein